MDTGTYKKLLVFDFNLDYKLEKQGDHHYKDLPLVYSLIQQASKWQPIVILTDGCLIDARSLVNSLNITNGFIVVNGGAVIYSLNEQKVIDEINIDNVDAQTIVHHGIMNNLNVGIYTKDKKFMFANNVVLLTNEQQKSFSEHEIINSYDLLKETLSRTDILDISYFTFNTVDHEKYNNILNKINNFFEGEKTDIIIHSLPNSSYVHIRNKNVNKLKAINKVMALSNITHLSDVLYVAANCADKECTVAFKNTLYSSSTRLQAENSEKKHDYLADKIEDFDPQFGLNTNSFWK